MIKTLDFSPRSFWHKFLYNFCLKVLVVLYPYFFYKDLSFSIDVLFFFCLLHILQFRYLKFTLSFKAFISISLVISLPWSIIGFNIKHLNELFIFFFRDSYFKLHFVLSMFSNLPGARTWRFFLHKIRLNNNEDHWSSYVVNLSNIFLNIFRREFGFEFFWE